MTKTQFRKKVRGMKPDLWQLIDERIEKFLLSPCVDLKPYEDNYILPKCFMSAMGDEIKFQYNPHSPQDLRTRNKIANIL